MSNKTEIPPGFFGADPSNIKIYENFIEPDDLQKIQDFCPRINAWDNSKESVYDKNGVCLYDAEYWRDRHCSASILNAICPQVYLIIDKYINKMAAQIEVDYGLRVSKRPPVIMRWVPGNLQQPHADKQLNDGSPNAFPDYDLNSIIYYNDDYVGGDLYYPQHGITVRPKPGMAVIHPGDINYLHGVTPVVSGNRFTTPSFYTVTEVIDKERYALFGN